MKIGARIKELREGTTDLSQTALADALGVTPQAVQKWEAGDSNPRANKLPSIAGALNTTVSELIRGTEMEDFAGSASGADTGGSRVSTLRSTRKGVPDSESGFLPLISWVQAVGWGQRMGKFKPADAEDWIRCPFDHGKHAFILEVQGESNFDPVGPKSYAPGDFIAVDPGREPVNRSMVIVRVDHEERAKFKQLLTDEGGIMLLKDLNPSWPNRVAAMPEGSKIIGVVIGKWVPE